MKSYSLSVLLFFLSLAFEAHAQTYQNSIFKGINVSASFSPVIFASNDLLAMSKIQGGLVLKLNFGISESFGVLAKYNRVIKSNVEGKDIGYFIATIAAGHEFTSFGLRYNFLSEESKLRLSLEGTTGIIESKFDLYDDKSNSKYILNAKGLGFGGGLAVDYFPKPFYSIELSGSYHTGNYKEAEYFGSLYKENTPYTFLSFSLGLTYHFSGR
jgi:hypothetical protein